MPANPCPYCGPFQLCQAGSLDDCYAEADDAEDEPVYTPWANGFDNRTNPRRGS